MRRLDEYDNEPELAYEARHPKKIVIRNDDDGWGRYMADHGIDPEAGREEKPDIPHCIVCGDELSELDEACGQRECEECRNKFTDDHTKVRWEEEEQ